MNTKIVHFDFFRHQCKVINLKVCGKVIAKFKKKNDFKTYPSSQEVGAR